jgi:hypothetical protein
LLLSSSFSHGARAQHQALTVVIVEQQVQEALAYAIRALGWNAAAWCTRHRPRN